MVGGRSGGNGKTKKHKSDDYSINEITIVDLEDYPDEVKAAAAAGQDKYAVRIGADRVLWRRGDFVKAYLYENDMMLDCHIVVRVDECNAKFVTEVNAANLKGKKEDA